MEQTQGVPAGYVLVPVEPTEAMEIAGGIALESSSAHDVIGPLMDAWAAMLSAAPQAQPSIQDLAAGAHYPQVTAWGNQAPQAQPAAEVHDSSTWSQYVAGVIGCYLGLDDDKDSAKLAGIAGIIERRRWAQPAQPVREPMSENQAMEIVNEYTTGSIYEPSVDGEAIVRATERHYGIVSKGGAE